MAAPFSELTASLPRLPQATQVPATARVLIATPVLTRPGGVAQYFHAIRPHFREYVQYFEVGSRRDGEGVAHTLARTLRDCWRFAVEIRSGRYDLVQLNPSFVHKALIREGALLLVAKMLGKTAIVFMHGWNENCERSVRRHHLLPLFRRVYWRADGFIVLATEFRNRLRDMSYTKPVYLQTAPIEDGLLSDALSRTPRVRSTIRQPFNVLFLARMEKTKGIYEALEAYNLLRKRNIPATFTVAGDGSEMSAVRQFLGSYQMPDVKFLGHVEGTAKQQAFREADAYILPSYGEGFPLSVLEAMVYGLPVITRSVGGLKDFFQDSRMGYITDSLDPAIFAALLAKLASNPDLCARIAQFNRTYARENFTAARIASNLLGIYDKQLDIRRQSPGIAA